jgi:hypothetical protein
MTRVFMGYDASRLDISKWAKRNRDALGGAQYIAPFGWFALQDGIDWATYAVRTTIDTQRFTNGTVASPGASITCGGEFEVAIVTPSGGVNWIRRMTLTA